VVIGAHPTRIDGARRREVRDDGIVTRSTSPSDRARAIPAPALVLGAILSVQVGAAIATTLVRDLGPLLTVMIRLCVAAAVLLVVARPSLRGRSGRDWGVMALLGLSLAVMNVTFYNAIARLPLGVVTTIEFLGPLGLAAVASRRPRDFASVALALAGVVAVSGALTESWASMDLAGLAFTVIAGAAWAGYIVATRAVGRRWSQLDGLAVAMALAAVMVIPLGLGSFAAVAVAISIAHLAAGAGVAVLSSVVPYSLELLALRRLPTRVFGILLSLEPAASALIGFLLLGQALHGLQWAGLLLVTAASAIVLADQREAPEVEAAEIG
jgi:inner membrane transporter RhtA